MLIRTWISSGAIACLVAAGWARATPAVFESLKGNPSIVWTTTPLNKGDVIELHAFKAQPGMIVFLGICPTDRCNDIHVVKNMPAFRPPANSVSEKYTLEESGHLVFWTVKPPRPELNTGASRALSDDSRNQVADVVHSGFSALYTDASVLRMHKLETAPDQAKARFDAGCYVTLTRVSEAAPAPGE